MNGIIPSTVSPSATTGGLGNKPPLFDTSDIGTCKHGDPDLESPNERCPNAGPGQGEGGKPAAPCQLRTSW
jgi:hypothetical protein